MVENSHQHRLKWYKTGNAGAEGILTKVAKAVKTISEILNIKQNNEIKKTLKA